MEDTAKYEVEKMGHDKQLEIILITKLTKIVQRFEHEGIELTTGDIHTIWRAKTYLGYCTPESLSQGTGAMVRDIDY